MLQDALVKLLAEQSFESITVAEITDTAMVNHATFYRHFRDKYGLAEAIFTEAIDSIPFAETKPDSSDFRQSWASLFKHVEKNDRLYKTLMGSGGNASFLRRIREHIVSIARKSVEKKIKLNQPIFGTRGVAKVPASDLPFIFVANLFMGNIAWWLEDGRQFSCDQVLEWTRRFVEKGLGGLLRE
jgi:AcrR family transcriptional regulator